MSYIFLTCSFITHIHVHFLHTTCASGFSNHYCETIQSAHHQTNKQTQDNNASVPTTTLHPHCEIMVAAAFKQYHEYSKGIAWLTNPSELKQVSCVVY